MPKLNPPEAIDFQHPKWNEWKTRFNRYRVASKLSQDEGEIQVATLIYTMGREAEDIFASFTFENEEQTNEYQVVLQKFEDYFIPKRNIIWERSKFHKRDQEEHESVEEFIRVLYKLTEHCEFQDRDTQIRDRLVIGLKDKTVCQKLQLKEDLTLEKAKEIALNHELVKKQNTEIAQVDFVKKHKQKPEKFRSSDKRSPPESKQKCGKCGKTHVWGKCPAYGKECHTCKKRNHFATMCKNGTNTRHNRHKQFHQVQQVEQETLSEYFIGSIETNIPPWTTNIELLGKTVVFKIDTGADVNVLNQTSWKELGQPTLEKSDARLLSPAGNIKTLGRFKVRINGCQTDMYVVNNPTCNLLSRSTASHMGLVRMVDSVGTFGKVNCQPVKIKLKEDARPHAIAVARRVPIPLMVKVEKELQRMKENDIIEEINEPTDWVSPMVVVPKSSGQVRICVDLKKLNASVERERYIIPTMDDIIHKLENSKVFSKLDAASGYWQIPLDRESAKLTTFLTPVGRFFFKRLPFGISSAPEIFQKIMEGILGNMDGVICYFDDILIHTEDETSHRTKLIQVKEKLQKAGLLLNEEKCAYFQSEVKFLGHIVSAAGVRPDPEKVEVIKNMEKPEDLPALRRFLGMVQYLGRYVQNLSEILGPLNELLRKESSWTWGPLQDKAFNTVKDKITSSTILAFYDPNKETTVSADASSYGLGAVLLQKHQDGMRPVAYCSRSLTQAEGRYAQIEKECLAATWACERFDKYLVGLESFMLLTDHKPLVPLINNKHLNECPLRCQRMLMRLMRFKITAQHTPGKEMVIADTLSRCPAVETQPSNLQSVVEEYVGEIVSSWPASDAKLNQIRMETEADVCLKATREYVVNGWPLYKEDVQLAALSMFPYRGELSVVDGLLVKGDRIVIPYSMRTELLETIHQGHFGITKSMERAKGSVWWPDINSDIKQMIAKCKSCLEKKPTQRKEPLLPSQSPDRPFERVGTDICEKDGQSYLVLVDYYSRFIEIMHLPNTQSYTVIMKLKCCFSRYGIPSCVVSDNARQFTSNEFKKFSKDWNFEHKTSSPRYPQSNGAAERAVKTAKEILSQKDVFLAVLAYRSTPLVDIGMSPAELLFGRKIRNTLPCLPSTLDPQHINQKEFRTKDQKLKQKQKERYDRRHGVRNLPEIERGETVLVKTDLEKGWRTPARVLEKVAPRSYMVRTESHGDLRRNRRHLQQVPPDVVYDIPEHNPDLDIEENRPRRTQSVEKNNQQSIGPTEPTPDPPFPQPEREPVLRRSSRQIKAPIRLICEQ